MINLFNSINGYTNKGANAEFQNVINANANRAVKEVTTSRNKRAASEVFPFKKLLNNQILSSLPDGEFASLLPHLEPVSLSAGENIYKPEEAFKFIYFPEDAVISQLHVLANGNSTEVAMIGKEGIVGLCALFSAQPPNYWTEVLNGGTALRIETEKLKSEFGRCGALRAALLNFANSQLAQISQRAVCNSHHVVEERLCNWLLMLHDRVPYNQLSLTQDQIARHLGVYRPGVTLAAVSLREKGLIDYSRGSMNILNRQGLELLSCECYPALKENLLPV